MNIVFFFSSLKVFGTVKVNYGNCQIDIHFQETVGHDIQTIIQPFSTVISSCVITLSAGNKTQNHTVGESQTIRSGNNEISISELNFLIIFFKVRQIFVLDI